MKNILIAYRERLIDIVQFKKLNVDADLKRKINKSSNRFISNIEKLKKNIYRIRNDEAYDIFFEELNTFLNDFETSEKNKNQSLIEYQYYIFKKMIVEKENTQPTWFAYAIFFLLSYFIYSLL